MPISSFYGLQTSLRGLLAQQRSIDITGHNIANASTRGYSRQEATLTASDALFIPAGAVQNGAGAHLGSGVDVQSYRRVRDTFLDLQFRTQSTALGGNAARSEALDRAELALAEPSDDGLAAQLAQFWNAWSNLANTPEANQPAARQALLSQARALGDAFGAIDAQFQTVGTQAQEEYDATIGGELKSIAAEIADLNLSIKKFVTAGDSPNDLLDRRDALLDRLSELGQVSVSNGAEAGSIIVKFGAGGEPLVNDAGVNPAWTASFTDGNGRLGGLLQSATQTIPAYRAALSGVAEQLAGAVNAIHPGFFGFTAGTATGAMKLEPLLAAGDIRAASGTSPGANDIAQAVAALRGGAADSGYEAFVARLGTETREVKRQVSNGEVLTRSVDDRRQSVSGVAMDEEMSNLVRFQRAYQASARAMSTMDEMLDVLINRTGRVGI